MTLSLPPRANAAVLDYILSPTDTDLKHNLSATSPGNQFTSERLPNELNVDTTLDFYKRLIFFSSFSKQPSFNRRYIGRKLKVKTFFKGAVKILLFLIIHVIDVKVFSVKDPNIQVYRVK